jgi:hypothetical protein
MAIAVAPVPRSWPLPRTGWGRRAGHPHQPLLPRYPERMVQALRRLTGRHVRAAVVGGCALPDLHVVNHSATSHGLQLEGGSTGTGVLAPGQARTIRYGIFGRAEQ